MLAFHRTTLTTPGPVPDFLQRIKEEKAPSVAGLDMLGIFFKHTFRLINSLSKSED